MQGNEGIAAWIICEDLLVKVKTELANEAIITLQNEVKAGRMKIDGRLAAPNEITGDAERDLFVANEIAHESGGMLESYAAYINDKERDQSAITSEEVERMEAAKRLMMAIQEITILINYRTVVEEWILEIEGIPTINEPITLLGSTIRGNEDDRFHALDFVLKRRSIIDENIFTTEERRIMESALRIVDPAYRAKQ